MTPEERVALVADLRRAAGDNEGGMASLLTTAADALDGPAQRELVDTCLRWFLGFPGRTIYKRRDGVTQDEYERTIREALDELGVYRKWAS